MKKKKLFTLMLATLIAIGVTVPVSADDVKSESDPHNKKVVFTVSSRDVKDNNDKLILIYSGEKTDIIVQLNPENEYTYTDTVPAGTYALTEISSLAGYTYDFQIGDSFTLVTEGTTIDVATLDNAELSAALAKAKAQEQTEHNLDKMNKIQGDAQKLVQKVGDDVNATADEKTKSNKSIVVIIIILIVLVAGGITASCVYRNTKKRRVIKTEDLLSDIKDLE